jgi:predicted double-glycine peptidase
MTSYCRSFALLLLLPTIAHAASRAPKPLRGERIHLPGVRQATGYTCGTGAAQSILLYFGKGDDHTEKYLAKAMGTNWKNGTEPKQIARYLAGEGVPTSVRNHMTIPDLKAALRKGQPVILTLQAWPNRPQDLAAYERDQVDGHYVVAIGYNRDHLLFMDPSIGGARGKLTEPELLARWHDTDNRNRPIFQQLGIVVTSRSRPVNTALYNRALHID